MQHILCRSGRNYLPNKEKNSGRKRTEPNSTHAPMSKRQQASNSSGRPLLSKASRWPTISQKSGLKVEELIGRDIFQVAGVLTEAEAQCFTEVAETSGFQHQGSRGPAFGEAYRDNGRFAVQDMQLAQSLWERGLQEVFRDIRIDGSRAVGLNPNIRMYRYEPGQRFGKHIDESNQVGPWHTKYTLLIYLSGAGVHAGNGSNSQTKPDKLRGGETCFYGGKKSKLLVSVTPEIGLALLHKHGEDCLEHEALEVLAGKKYILRSDVLFD